jgi:hypothetical protein
MKTMHTTRLWQLLRRLGFGVAALLTVTSIAATPVFAASTAPAAGSLPGDPPVIDGEQRQHYALEGIYYIDNACPAGADNTVATGDTTGGGGGSGSFKPHVKAAFQFFISHGWSAAQSAGIVGNLMQESGSGIDPTASDGVAHGIAQWQGGRLQPMWNWVASWANANNDPDGKNSFNGQLNYIEYDLTHGHSSVGAIIKKASTPRDAANDWNKYYEISADTSSTRGDNATKVYNAAQSENWAAGITVVPEPGDQASSDADSSCGGDTAGAGTVSGKTCKDIGKKSDDSDPKDPYRCDSSELKCDAGTDAGVGAAYAGGKPYRIRLCKVDGVIVNAFVAVNIDSMVKAAAADGIKLSGGGGGFRTMDAQIAIRRSNGCPADHLGSKDANGFYNYDTLVANKNATSPTTRCRTAAAPPGFSNHQTGLAVDWSYNGSTIGSHSSPAFKWMAAHAQTYGFYNFPVEPWHWSVDGA